MKHKKIKMTFADYDALVEKMLTANPEKPKEYPPLKDLIEAADYEDKSKVILNYMIWLSEVLDAPVTDEEKEFRKTLNKILNERIVLYDEEDVNDNNSCGKA